MGGLKLKGNKGFSLIEVLIAMSILTIGILAVVSMQTTAL
ncbi:MAG: prepilin-type N-terminal cleavage/methylation domain-containing protein, partial [Proteobacteria bacterium]|nr:prepilin-type N-terminal cleavage/methylation domain-containing protein [Pseudomonadota bacterium]